MNIMDNIRSQYHSLSRGQKLIGDYVMANPEQVCFLSLKDFSAELNTTPVSVLRFTQKLGVSNYVGLKKELQAYISQRLTPGEKMVNVLDSKVATDQNFVSEVFQMDLDNINSTYEMLKADQLLAAVEVLKRSERVYLAAHNTSKSISTFLFSRLNSISIDAQHFDLDSIKTLNARLTHVRPTDAFILVSFSKYARQALFLAKELKARDVPIICITDRLASPLADYADIAFACATNTPIFFNSYSAPMMVANILTSVLAFQMEDRLREMQSEIKRLNQAYQAFSSESEAAGKGRDDPLL